MYRRRPLRLRGFDYTAGLYFVTSCVRDRACVLGAVVDETVHLTRLGIAARECLLAIPDHHRSVVIDSFVVMPNHVHLILTMDGEELLGTVVGTYKAAVSRSSGHRGLWQRGYYEHVIRDDFDLQRIREYIATNPVRWEIDPENPAHRS